MNTIKKTQQNKYISKKKLKSLLLLIFLINKSLTERKININDVEMYRYN